MVNIEGVVSGGSNDASYDEWVESYKVKYTGVMTAGCSIGRRLTTSSLATDSQEIRAL